MSLVGTVSRLDLPPQRVAFPMYGASDSWADQTFCASAQVVFTGSGEITAATLRRNAATVQPLDGIVLMFFSASPGIALDAAVSALTAAIMATHIGSLVFDSTVNPDKFLPTSAVACTVHKPDTSIQISSGAAVWAVAFNNTGAALTTGASESIDGLIHFRRTGY